MKPQNSCSPDRLIGPPGCRFSNENWGLNRESIEFYVTVLGIWVDFHYYNLRAVRFLELPSRGVS
jgi:hypothetical protein